MARDEPILTAADEDLARRINVRLGYLNEAEEGRKMITKEDVARLLSQQIDSHKERLRDLCAREADTLEAYMHVDFHREQLAVLREFEGRL